MRAQKKESVDEINKEHNLSETLTTLMKEAKLKDPELSRLTGVPVSTLLKLRTLQQTNPTVETLLPIANFFGINIQQLLGLEAINRPKGSFSPQHRKFKSVPVINLDEVMKWSEDRDAVESTSTRKWAETSAELLNPGFAIIAKDTMTLGRYPENSVMIFDSIEKAKDKDIVIVQIENINSILIKQILIDSDEIYFKPFNPELEKIIFGTNYKIFGIMKQVIINT